MFNSVKNLYINVLVGGKILDEKLRFFVFRIGVAKEAYRVLNGFWTLPACWKYSDSFDNFFDDLEGEEKRYKSLIASGIEAMCEDFTYWTD